MKVNCLLPDGAQTLWVGTDQGIVSWDGQNWTIDPHTHWRDSDGVLHPNNYVAGVCAEVR